MDKLKGVTKGGWHPSGDRQIHRDTWKSDLKGIATGKKHDPFEEARNHQSAPLSTLKDPDSFGPPPKHSAYYGSQSPASQPSTSMQTLPQSSGLGARVPTSRPQKADLSEDLPKPAVPYRADTTGLRTDNLPRPPGRSVVLEQPNAQQRSLPSLPPRQAGTPTAAPRATPVLPPRQNEYPDEHTAPPPPPYTATTRQVPEVSKLINQDAVRNLGRAGVNVPAFGISTNSQPSSAQASVSGPQISELQQRFAKMNHQDTADALSPVAGRLATAAAQKKAPPPPPKPKTIGLANTDTASASSSIPPPIPLSSKPRP